MIILDDISKSLSRFFSLNKIKIFHFQLAGIALITAGSIALVRLGDISDAFVDAS